MQTQTLFADYTVSLSEFKKNPSKIASAQHGHPVAVLNRNKAAFYVVDPTVFEAMLEEIDNARLAPLVKARLQTGTRVKVTLDTLATL